jgi:four helix bundle protein
MGDFHHLKAWQHAKALAVEAARAAARFPPDERFALADQLRRAAYGAALSVAEGASRRGPREYRQYLAVARASLTEVQAILEIAVELGYLEPTARARLEARRDEAAKTVFGLLRAVSAKLDDTPPGQKRRGVRRAPRPRTPLRSPVP